VRLFLLLLFVLPASLALAETLPTVVGSGTAVEGDSISVNGQVVKLWGIDAPETGQKCRNKLRQSYDCFSPSKNTLQSLIGQNQITCYIRGSDRHGQQIGTCAVNDLDLAALMVRSGWAMAYFNLTPQYVGLEADAQAQSKGLWAGHADPPWVWRTKNKKKP
jgi:endonuclease YncB( thermonuclease family)